MTQQLFTTKCLISGLKAVLLSPGKQIKISFSDALVSDVRKEYLSSFSRRIFKASAYCCASGVVKFTQVAP